MQTGDLGYFDADGQLWLLGRAKDMVKTGGENVFASEVEAVLCSHPDVLAAAVVGAPDERLGEKVGGGTVGWTGCAKRFVVVITTYLLPLIVR